MIFHKQQTASMNRVHMCGDSLAEATTKATDEAWEVGSIFEDIKNDGKYIYSSNGFYAMEITLGGTIEERAAVDTTKLPVWKTTYIVYDGNSVTGIYLLTKDGWRLM